MDSSGRIGKAIFNARADAIRAHARFPIAKQRFRSDVPAMWLASPLNRCLIPDTGAMAVSITVIRLNRLDPAFADRPDLWVARDLAIVAIWLDAKRPASQPQVAA
ncbi:MAG: hypothetical protein ACK5SX_02685 [Sandaracinobacter sp.]